MKHYTIFASNGQPGEDIPEFALIGEGTAATYVPLSERYHPDFLALLVEYDPKNPPPRVAPTAPKPTVVTMRQARLALLAAGKLTAVNDAIRDIPGTEGDVARIEWEFAVSVERSSGLVRSLAMVLGLSESDLDALFENAATL